MIIAPILDKYRHADFIQYINNVLQIVTEEKATALTLNEQRTALQQSSDELNAVWAPNKGSELTAQIAELDQLRDGLFTGLKLTVDAWSKHHFNATKKQAALAVSLNLASHGKKITTLRYQQQTAVLNGILNDLQNELSAEITTLELTEWVTELQTANANFDALYVNRAIEVAANVKGIVEQLRTASTAHFKTLKTVFEARATVAAVENSPNKKEFEILGNEWNSLTQQYNEAVTRTYQSNSSTPPQDDPTSAGSEDDMSTAV